MEKQFGKYTLLQRLGGGGMAEVFKARLHGPEGFEKDLALKLILPHISDEPEFVKMFIREATLVARLDHANIVRIHEFDQVEGRYYIAMELVSGRDLRQMISRARKINRPFAIPEVLALAVEVSKGLAFAHGELTPDSPEVVHRDISPHNIIISVAGEVKITDFGIAKLATAAGHTQTGIIKGKAAYMSPEQAQGKPVDRRSDLFSLGCVLWELLTSQKLFTAENDVAVLEKLKTGTILPPSTYNSAASKELDDLILGLLQRDPAKRTASAGTLAREADRALLDFPDIDRATLLMDLYRDLFSVPEAGTGVLPVADLEDGDLGSRPSDSVEPVGPEAVTRDEEGPPRLPDRRPRRLWPLGAAFFVAVVVAGFIVAGPYWFNEPDPVPAPDAGLVSAVTRPKPPPPAPAPPEPEVTELPVEPRPEEPKPEPKTKARVKTGRLDLNAIPWAKVYLGKKYLGETPLERVELPVGKHALVLVNKDLGIRKTVWVKIRSKRTAQHLIDLKK